MRLHTEPKLPRQSLSQGLALLFLLFMGGLALIGPSGLLSWSENSSLLEQRQLEVKKLTAERDELRNRVALLNPGNMDPDITAQLLHQDLNVIHPDEIVIQLPHSGE